MGVGVDSYDNRSQCGPDSHEAAEVYMTLGGFQIYTYINIYVFRISLTFIFDICFFYDMTIFIDY